MKFFSYSNHNKNYTKAISLENARSLSITSSSGKSAIRFSVVIDYHNGTHESFFYLEEEESKKLYKEILDLLNK
jgi:hypothetical protein